MTSQARSVRSLTGTQPNSPDLETPAEQASRTQTGAVATGYDLCNGIALTADGTVLLVCETLTSSVWAHRIHPSGAVDDRELFARLPGGQMPECLKTPRLLNDEKTFVLLCTTTAKTAYTLAFNAAPHGGFANAAGRPAEPAKLAFSTNDDDGPRDLDDALKIAKLTHADVPIATQP